MNDKIKKDYKLTIELIVVGLILAVIVFLFMSNNGNDTAFAAAAANARKPLGEVFSALINKYF